MRIIIAIYCNAFSNAFILLINKDILYSLKLLRTEFVMDFVTFEAPT